MARWMRRPEPSVESQVVRLPLTAAPLRWIPSLAGRRSEAKLPARAASGPIPPLYALFLVMLVGLSGLLALRKPVTTFEVISSSMTPTIVRGDKLLAVSCSLLEYWPQPGDLVTFHPPTWVGADPPVVKRVVATGGDLVAIRDGALHVNGRRLREPYAGTYSRWYRYGPIQVPPGQVFVLGDNRAHSEDSTTYGPVPVSRIDELVLLRMTPGHPVCSLTRRPSVLPDC